MLGLSLAIRVGRRLLGSFVDSLMSAVKGRATYSENIADSKQVLKDIDNYELLDKASILLTPTAYSNARVHSVKTYTGDELVNSSNWINSTSGTATITDGVITFVNGTGLLTQGIISANTTYKFSVTLSNLSLGNLRITTEGGVNDKTLSTSGVHEFYLNSTSAGALFLLPQSSFTGSIDNVSVTEADADFDFDRASSATRINSDGLVQDMQSITDPELVLNGDFEELGDEEITNGTFDADSDWILTQATISNGVASFATTDGSFAGIRQNVFTTGKTYLISLDVSDLVGIAEVNTNGGTSIGLEITTNGTKSFYMKAQNTDIEIKRKFGQTNVSATIDNVSVQQVDPNDRWTLGTGWSIEDSKLVANSSSNGNDARQLNLLEQSRDYKLSIDISKTSGTDVKLKIYNGSSFVTIAELDENSTVNFSTSATNNGTLYVVSNAFVGTIDNISVKDITFSEDVDLARINYDSNGENGHWLLEPTSTNLVTYSEDFTEYSISTTNLDTPTIVSITNPTGVNSAGLLNINNGVSASKFIYLGISTSSSIHTQSIFVKYVDRQWIQLLSGGTSHYANFDIQNGVVGNTSGCSSTIEDYGNGWYRCTATLDSAATPINLAIAVIDDNTATRLSASTGTGSYHLFGGQVEALSYATSYIPTYGSTVTRATETLTGSGNSTLINSTEGVLYAEIAALADDGGNRRISISDGSETNRLNLFYTETTNEIKANYRVSNSTVVTIDTTDFNITNFNKIAFRWQSGNFVLFINGENKGTNSNTTMISANTLNVLRFEDPNLVNEFYGKCKALAVFDEALTDDELELLTGITNYGSFNELAQANGYTII